METRPDHELHLEYATDSFEEEVRIFSLTTDDDENLINVLVNDETDKKLSVYALTEKGE